MDNISILNTDDHICIKEVMQDKSNNLILDVRPELEFKMCNLPGTVNFPFSKIEKQIEIDKLKNIIEDNLSQGKKRGRYTKPLNRAMTCNVLMAESIV